MSFVADLDTPLLQLSPRDVFTLRDAFTGVHIFGGIGSGKTSGSGQALAGAYLRAGMGGLVLCAKPEEVELWLSYAKAHGRSQSILLFDERHGFNFIAYELARQGADGIGSVVECLMRILESADQVTGATGKASEPFWAQTTRQVLGYTVPLLYCAYGSVTIAAIIDFVMSAATTPALWQDEQWLAESFAAQTVLKAASDPAMSVDDGTLRALLNYWKQEYIRIPEKTRGNIQISLSAQLDRFRRGRLSKVFCGRTTIVPELTFHGVIIVMKMPVLTWNEDGIIGQQLFKFMWQRAVESRNGLDPAQRTRPVFLWADEAQYFVNVKDDEFLSTCRGSRACVVFLSQTLPSYYARLGKERTDAADGLVGKFNTQVFHLNACNRTNRFAADLVGRCLQERRNTNRSLGTNRSRGMNSGGNVSSGSSYSSGSASGGSGSSSNSSAGGTNSSGQSWGQNLGQGRNESESWGTSEQMDYMLEPRVFASELKAGGPRNGNRVTAVWVKTGGNFADTHGGNVLFPTFQQ